MRTKLIAGNWKMNTTLADAHVIADGVRNAAEHMEKIEIVLCPPAIWLTELAHHGIAPQAMKHLKLGAQNMYFEEAGAFTGEISPLMIKEVAEYVIIGHSERTHIFKEDTELVAVKVASALHHGLTPILCLGEDVQETGSKHRLVMQLRAILDGLRPADIEKLVVAYEPVWAIGSGKPATAEYAQEIISALREEVTEHTRILYGGSANDENARSYLEQPDIDGLLIGGASLKLKTFVTMCQIADDLSTK